LSPRRQSPRCSLTRLPRAQVLLLPDAPVQDAAAARLPRSATRLRRLSLAGWGSIPSPADADAEAGPWPAAPALADLDLCRSAGALGALFSGAAGAGALGVLRRLILARARVADAELAPLATLAALRALDVSECPRLTSRALAYLPGGLTHLWARGLRLVAGDSGDAGDVGGADGCGPASGWADEEEETQFEMDSEDEEEGAGGGKGGAAPPSVLAGAIAELEAAGVLPVPAAGAPAAGLLRELGRLRRLVELDLSATRASVPALLSAGGTPLLPGSLRRLRLDGCAALCPRLAEALPPALTHLHLNGCAGVSDAGLEAAARRCPGLSDLSAVGVSLGDHAAAAVARLRSLQAPARPTRSRPL